jgi:predicted methyltransferase
MFYFLFSTNRTKPSTDGNVQTEEMMMQVVKTELFDDVDFHNENIMREFDAYITDPTITMLTHHEILCGIANIVAKRKMPEKGMLDTHTGLRY